MKSALLESVTIKVHGMTCTLCSASIEAALEKLDGIKKVDVSYAAENAIIEYDNKIINIDVINAAISKLGFYVNEASDLSDEDKLRQLENKQLIKLIISAILTIPTLICMVSCALNICSSVVIPNGNPGKLNYMMYTLHDWRLQFAFATPVQFIIGADFYKKAFYSLLYKRPTMDLLVVLSSSAAYFYSASVVIFQRTEYLYCNQNLYLDASAAIITFVLLGKYLEAKAKGKMTESMKTLISLKPKTAR